MPIKNKEQNEMTVVDLGGKIWMTIFDYINLVECNSEDNMIAKIDFDRISASKISSYRKADILKIHELLNAGYDNNSDTYSVAELIHDYINYETKSGLLIFGYNLISGKSRLREMLNTTLRTIYPILIMDVEERDSMKKILAANGQEIIKNEPMPRFEFDEQGQVEQAIMQLEQLKDALEISHENNLKLIDRVDELEAELAEVNNKLRETERESAEYKSAYNKEKKLNHSLSTSIKNKDKTIEILSSIANSNIVNKDNAVIKADQLETQNRFTHFKTIRAS